MKYENKVGIISGGASGMGRVTARRLLQEGGSVVIADVNPAAFEGLYEEFKDYREHIACIECDVRSMDSVQAVADKAVELFGRIDYLFNFAGGESSRMCRSEGDFLKKPVEVIEWGLDVNLKGPIFFSRAVLPQMFKQNSGVIILLGSITGFEGGGGGAVDYAAAKSGLMTGVVKSLAQYGAPHNVRCCCVAPGPVMTRPGMANMGTLMGYQAQPEEVVSLIEFLISDEARSITGSTHMIDGGRAATHMQMGI